MRWFGARTVGEASRAMATNAGRALSPSRTWILLVGRHRALRRSLERQFRRRGHPYRAVDGLDELGAGELDGVGCVVVAEVSAGPIAQVARGALQDPRLARLPLEYATGLEPEQRQFRAQDEYADHPFVSPLLAADPSPYQLYDDSLRRFEQKCGLRDYLDLYQWLTSIEERRVRGDVAEFGSYKGHSGWLIARTLEALSSSRRLVMFDMFETFPEETAGIDYFWSGTHAVGLEEVRSKLDGMPHVELVAGEFETTVPERAPERLALAYVDCDSYRAVSYLCAELFERRLSPGGAIVFEDYGHPALLGCRLAVHEFFDGRGDCVRFFSQFSGLYCVVKL